MTADRRLALLLLLTAGCFGGGSEPPPNYLHDKVTTERVVNALQQSDGGPFREVRVWTESGTVHLAGTVPDPAAKQRAEALARQAADVDEVVNEIAVAGNRR